VNLERIAVYAIRGRSRHGTRNAEVAVANASHEDLVEKFCTPPQEWWTAEGESLEPTTVRGLD
jgi:hypothetical protein